jgi:AcrR family transcriptional regulator
MSGNHRDDPRGKRTRDRLGDALIATLLEKPFDDITVGEVLQRAGVARSTFYEHYRDKHDLFFSDVDEFFQWISTLLERQPDPGRVAPVRELFAHVAESRPLLAAMEASGRLDEVLRLGRAHFARSIERALGRSDGGDSAELQLLAHGLAGALLAMLERWLASEPKQTPAEMDELFHRLVERALGTRG